jgi:hypothetical protein
MVAAALPRPNIIDSLDTLTLAENSTAIIILQDLYQASST